MVRKQERANDDRGAAAVEFALLLPLLVLLLGGIIDFGFAFNAQISLTHAAREGVRVEAIGTSGDPVATATAAFLAPATTGFAANVTEPCSGAATRAVLQTQATYDFFFLPFGTRDLTSEAVMRCNG